MRALLGIADGHGPDVLQLPARGRRRAGAAISSYGAAAWGRSDRADVCGKVAFADRLPQTIAEAARARVEWERAVLSRVEMVLTAVQSGIADEEVP